MASIRPLMPDCCDFAAKASEAGASLLGVVDMNEFPMRRRSLRSAGICCMDYFIEPFCLQSGDVRHRNMGSARAALQIVQVGSPAVGFCFRIVGVKLRIGRCLLMGRLGRCLGALNGRSSLGWRKCFCRCILPARRPKTMAPIRPKLSKRTRP